MIWLPHHIISVLPLLVLVLHDQRHSLCRIPIPIGTTQYIVLLRRGSLTAVIFSLQSRPNKFGHTTKTVDMQLTQIFTPNSKVLDRLVVGAVPEKNHSRMVE